MIICHIFGQNTYNPVNKHTHTWSVFEEPPEELSPPRLTNVTDPPCCMDVTKLPPLCAEMCCDLERRTGFAIGGRVFGLRSVTLEVDLIETMNTTCKIFYLFLWVPRICIITMACNLILHRKALLLPYLINVLVTVFPARLVCISFKGRWNPFSSTNVSGR